MTPEHESGLTFDPWCECSTCNHTARYLHEKHLGTDAEQAKHTATIEALRTELSETGVSYLRALNREEALREENARLRTALEHAASFEGYAGQIACNALAREGE